MPQALPHPRVVVLSREEYDDLVEENRRLRIAVRARIARPVDPVLLRDQPAPRRVSSKSQTFWPVDTP